MFPLRPQSSPSHLCCRDLWAADLPQNPPEDAAARRWHYVIVQESHRAEKPPSLQPRRASFQPFWFLILLHRGCRIHVWSFDMFCSDSTKSRTDDFETVQRCIIHQRSLSHLCTWKQGAVPLLLVPALYFRLLAPSIIHPSILCQCSSLTLSFFQCFSYCPPSSINFIHGFYLFQLNIYNRCSPSWHVGTDGAWKLIKHLKVQAGNDGAFSKEGV